MDERNYSLHVSVYKNIAFTTSVLENVILNLMSIIRGQMSAVSLASLRADLVNVGRDTNLCLQYVPFLQAVASYNLY